MAFHEIRSRLLFLLRRKRFSQDLEEEMRLHVEQRAALYREDGMSPKEAQFAARRRFGNSTLLRETSRDLWNFTWLEQFLRDIRLAVRSSLRNPAFTCTAVLSLALAIGANTAVFSFVNAIVLAGLPVKGANRLVVLRQRNEIFHIENCCFSYAFFRELRQRDADFEDILTVDPAVFNLTGRGQTERMEGEAVSGNYFEMLGVRPALGRLLDESDDRGEGAGRACVISYRLWQES